MASAERIRGYLRAPTQAPLSRLQARRPDRGRGRELDQLGGALGVQIEEALGLNRALHFGSTQFRINIHAQAITRTKPVVVPARLQRHIAVWRGRHNCQSIEPAPSAYLMVR